MLKVVLFSLNSNPHLTTPFIESDQLFLKHISNKIIFGALVTCEIFWVIVFTGDTGITRVCQLGMIHKTGTKIKVLQYQASSMVQLHLLREIELFC